MRTKRSLFRLHRSIKQALFHRPFCSRIVVQYIKFNIIIMYIYIYICIGIKREREREREIGFATQFDGGYCSQLPNFLCISAIPRHDLSRSGGRRRRRQIRLVLRDFLHPFANPKGCAASNRTAAFCFLLEADCEFLEPKKSALIIAADVCEL